MKPRYFSTRERANSIRLAWDGILLFFREEHNARIHLVSSIAVLIASCYFRLSRFEIITLVIVTGFVWAAEILNTSMEKAMDLIVPEQHPTVKLIKDLAAAAVLIAAMTAVTVGAIIFIPKLF